jgi:hypothetical protein
MKVGEQLWNIISKDKNHNRKDTYGDKFQCIWILKFKRK